MLENQLQELTVAINRLSDILLAATSSIVPSDECEPEEEPTPAHEKKTKATKQAKTEPKPQEATEPEVESTPETPPVTEASEPTVTLTHDTVHATVMELVREKGLKKTKVKDLLATYKALTISELAEAELEEFKTKVEALV